MTWPYGRSKALLWVDLECTGSDKEHDEIVEVAALVTDFGFVEKGYYSRPIIPSRRGMTRLLNNEIVRQMHTDNGLLAELKRGSGVRLEQAEDDLVLWLRDYGEHELMLAGSGVSHFDRPFIERDMPTLSAKLSYPNLDIGTVRRFLAFCGALSQRRDKNERKSHRALDDIRQHVDEARQYRELVSPSDPYPRPWPPQGGSGVSRSADGET